MLNRNPFFFHFQIDPCILPKYLSSIKHLERELGVRSEELGVKNIKNNKKTQIKAARLKLKVGS
jgi:hypothetical protein